MKKIILFFIMSVSIMCIYSQQDYEITQKALQALSEKKYLLADSLFTKSIGISLDANKFFDRAVCRLFLMDTCGACDDFYETTRLQKKEDKEADSIYKHLCYKRLDTTFYNDEFREIDKSQKFKYYLVKKTYRCDSTIYFDVHKKNGKYERWLAFNNTIGYAENCSDIFASYVLRDTNKLFYYVYNHFLSDLDKEDMDDYNNRAKIFLNAKYKNLKDSSEETLTIKVEFVVNIDKKIEQIKILYNPLKINDKQVFEDFKNDIIKVVESFPKVKPLIFMKRPVKSLGYLDIYM